MPRRLLVRLWLVRGLCCAQCRCRLVCLCCFSPPLFGTVIQHGCWVRLLSGSLTLCGWGSIPLLSAGVHVPACWGFPAFALAGGAWASLFSLSGPCSRGCRAAWADAPSGGVRVSPVYLRSGRCWCCRVRVGNARSPVWGWCGFRACRRWGVGDDGMPVTVPVRRGCGFPCFWRLVLFAGAARPLGDGCFVGCVACCWFVAVCVV